MTEAIRRIVLTKDTVQRVLIHHQAKIIALKKVEQEDGTFAPILYVIAPVDSGAKIELVVCAYKENDPITSSLGLPHSYDYLASLDFSPVIHYFIERR